MNYTHRNIHSQKRCRIVDETNYDGHILYKVEDEAGERQIWTRTAFLANHDEIREVKPAPAIAAVLLALLVLLWLPYVGGTKQGGSATGCGQDGWPACTR